MTVRPEVCVGAVVVRDGALLLVRRGRGAGLGLWSVPGGRVESGELMRDAVVRELREETGLSGTCERFVGWVERLAPDHHFVILDFLVTVPAEAEAVAGDDAADVAWVALDRLAERDDLVPGLLAFLREHGVVPG